MQFDPNLTNLEKCCSAASEFPKLLPSRSLSPLYCGNVEWQYSLQNLAVAVFSPRCPAIWWKRSTKNTTLPTFSSGWAFTVQQPIPKGACLVKSYIWWFVHGKYSFSASRIWWFDSEIKRGRQFKINPQGRTTKYHPHSQTREIQLFVRLNLALSFCYACSGSRPWYCFAPSSLRIRCRWACRLPFAVFSSIFWVSNALWRLQVTRPLTMGFPHLKIEHSFSYLLCLAQQRDLFDGSES